MLLLCLEEVNFPIFSWFFWDIYTFCIWVQIPSCFPLAQEHVGNQCKNQLLSTHLKCFVISQFPLYHSYSIIDFIPMSTLNKPNYVNLLLVVIFFSLGSNAIHRSCCGVCMARGITPRIIFSTPPNTWIIWVLLVYNYHSELPILFPKYIRFGCRWHHVLCYFVWMKAQNLI